MNKTNQKAMKIRLKELVQAYQGITLVYDSVEKFSRKMELLKPYKEIKDIVSTYEEVRNIALMKDSREAAKELSEELNKELEITGMRFTIKEIENSKIPGSKLADITKFIEED